MCEVQEAVIQEIHDICSVPWTITYITFNEIHLQHKLAEILISIYDGIFEITHCKHRLPCWPPPSRDEWTTERREMADPDSVEWLFKRLDELTRKYVVLGQ